MQLRRQNSKMDNLNKVIGLVKQKKFSEAEKALLELRKKDYSNEVINYYLGVIYNDFNNPNKSDVKTRRYFGYVVDSDNPIEEAFIELANLEKNINHARRILKKGLAKFPKSVKLYERLLWKTETTKRNSIFEEIAKKGITSNDILIIKVETHYEQKEFNDALNVISQVELSDSEELKILNTIKAYCHLEINATKRAEKIFKELISEDIKHDLDYAPYFGLILCYLQESNGKKAFEILKDVPEETEIYSELFIPYSPLHFDFEKYLLRALSETEKATKDKIILGRIKGLRGLFFYSKSGNGKISSKIIRDLEYANRIFPRNVKFCERLKWNAEEKKRYFKAYKYSIQNIENVSEEDYSYLESWDFIKEADSESFTKIINDLKKRTPDRYYLLGQRIAKTILVPVIERLFEEQKFQEIVGLSELFNKEDLNNSEVRFEIAYAYSEVDDLLSAKEYYQLCVDKNGMTLAVANNLGIIYEKQGNLTKAQQLLREAQKLNPNDDISKRNLKRITELLEIQQKELLESRKAAEGFSRENLWIQSKILSFSKHRDPSGYIICPYRQLPQFLGVSSLKANDLMKTLLERKYLTKVTNHNLNTSSSVYRINPEIEKQLNVIEEHTQKESELLSIAERLNCENLEQIGYNKDLVSVLQKMSSQELQQMLKRDLKENALALIIKSYKTALIMSGSIIEAVLLDKISSKGLTTYKLENGKNKKVIQMDLNDLLYVANKEKIIEEQLFHLSHALRGFRNLIHPGVEQRKKAIRISEDNAQMAWDIVRKIIVEM